MSEKPWNAQPKVGGPHYIPPLRAQGKRSVRSGGVRVHQEDKELSVNMIDAHMNSQR